MKKKKIGRLERWKFDNIFLRKMKLTLWYYNKRSAVYKFFLCRHGWHRYIPQGIEIHHNDRCVLKLKWLECIHCDTLFFVSKEDRKKYRNYKKREQKQWKKLFESIKRRIKNETNRNTPNRNYREPSVKKG